MKILVTGGAGFIGSQIVDRLVKKNHQVVIIDNLSTGKKEYINPEAKFYNSDISKDDILSIFKKEIPELVIHTAAQVMLRESIKDPIHDANANIIGTIRILDSCKETKVKRIIYTSTGGARVGEPKYLPVDEDHPIHPLAPYGISKHTAEHYVEVYGKIYGLDYLIFCFGNVYGPRDDPKTKRVTAVFADKILRNEQPIIFGDGNQTRDFIYVEDLADFIVECINKNPEHKLFHLANGEQISVNQIFELLKKVSGYPENAQHIEAVPGEVRDICLDTTLAQKELGWHPKTNFEQGLKRTFEWFKSKDKINL